MKTLTQFAMLLSLVCFNLPTFADDETNVLIFTGGHGFDRAEFFEVFDHLDGVNYSEIQHPNANWIFTDDYINRYDVVVLYDMWQPITEAECEGMVKYLNSGKGLVVMHHALANYQDWEQFLILAGGMYVLQDGKEIAGKPVEGSTYKHDVEVDVKVVDQDHPITQGLDDFTIIDEVYGKLYYKDNIHALLGTDHPEGSKHVAWVTPHDNAKIVTIQLGHDKQAFQNKNFQQLIQNAVTWAAQSE